MKIKISFYALLCILTMAAPSWCKRGGAPIVEPVIYENIKYIAPNDNGVMEYVEAWDLKSKKKIWNKIIYTNSIQEGLEKDVQWVFIRKLIIDKGSLLITDERDRQFILDLKTKQIKTGWRQLKMKYYKVYGYNANLSELWRLSKKNPLKFIIALFLKTEKSTKLVFEQPDADTCKYVSYDEITSISPEIIDDLADIKKEIEGRNYILALVKHLDTDRNTVFNLVFVSSDGNSYIPLLWGKGKSKSSEIKEIRYAIISLDTNYVPIVTTRYYSNFDPMPSAIFTVLPDKSLSELDEIHSGILKKHRKELIKINAGNIRELVIKYEDLSYNYFLSRGIYSEKYER